MNDLFEKLNEYKDVDPREIRLNVFNLEHAGEIQEAIRKVFPNTLILISQDKSLLGGYTIRIKDNFIDSSFSSKVGQFQNFIEQVKVTDKKSLSQDLKDHSKKFSPEDTNQEIGIVESVKDGICKINGLSTCMYQEIIEFESKVKGVAFNLEGDSVGAIILGDFTTVRTGEVVKRTGKVISVPVEDNLLGRVINPLGELLDNGPELVYEQYYPIEKVAPGVMTRKPVDVPLQTGIKSIDALIPVGRGQRELILGDRQTGKTTIAIDTIINQKDSGVICIYVAIGQKESKIAKLVEKLKKHGAMDYTIIVSASASKPSSLLYLAPYSGTAIAEYFADKGKDVLIVYDDLTKHAVAYREMSLLLRRPPGREAYPGDVFYLHSRLLERSCRLNENYGGGSITALPIIETQAGDISAYIPTNVISITDGQIFLESDLFNKGIRPAINVGLSVSRVGGSAQIKPMKKVAGSMKISLAQFRELEAFAQFSSDLDPNTKKQIDRGRRVTEILKQKPLSPLKVADQVLIIYAISNGYFDEFELNRIGELEAGIIEFANRNYLQLIKEIANGKWDSDTEEQLKSVCANFIADINKDGK